MGLSKTRHLSIQLFRFHNLACSCIPQSIEEIRENTRGEELVGCNDDETTFVYSALSHTSAPGQNYRKRLNPFLLHSTKEQIGYWKKFLPTLVAQRRVSPNPKFVEVVRNLLLQIYVNPED